MVLSGYENILIERERGLIWFALMLIKVNDRKMKEKGLKRFCLKRSVDWFVTFYSRQKNLSNSTFNIPECKKNLPIVSILLFKIITFNVSFQFLAEPGKAVS